MTMKDTTAPEEIVVKNHKVVISLQDGTIIRGHFRLETPANLNSIMGDLHSNFQEALGTCCLSENGTALDLDWSQVKAVFFVSSFKGDCEHESVRFYTGGPEVQSIWVEVGFRDGEVIEGFIRNSLHHLEDSGFFLRPSTPGSNNLLLYVNKSAIVSYRVLGVRALENG